MYHILSIYKMTMRDGVGSRGELIQVSIVRIGSVAVAGSNCNNTIQATSKLISTIYGQIFDHYKLRNTVYDISII